MKEEYWINDNGTRRRMRGEEITDMQKVLAELPHQGKTEEQRIQELEDELKAAKILLGLEENV